MTFALAQVDFSYTGLSDHGLWLLLDCLSQFEASVDCSIKAEPIVGQGGTVIARWSRILCSDIKLQEIMEHWLRHRNLMHRTRMRCHIAGASCLHQVDPEQDLVLIALLSTACPKVSCC